MKRTMNARAVRQHVQNEGTVRQFLKRDGARLVKSILRDSGMSLRELARRSDCSPSYLSQIQNGKATISPGAYLKLSELEK